MPFDPNSATAVADFDPASAAPVAFDAESAQPLAEAPGLFTRLAGKVAEGIQADNPEQITDPATLGRDAAELFAETPEAAARPGSPPSRPENFNPADLGAEFALARAVVTPENALRLGPPAAAFALAPVSGGATLPYALAATAALGGEYAAQKLEQAKGARERLSPGRMVAAPLVAGTPLGPVTKGAMFVKGTLAAARPLAPLVRAGAGAVITGGASAIEQGIDTGEVDFGEVAKSAAWGAVFGAVMGGAETFQMTRAQRAALFDLRTATGQWRMSDETFMAWLRNRATAVVPVRAPGRPAEEGAPVSPEPIQPLPENYLPQEGTVPGTATVPPAVATPAGSSPALAVKPAVPEVTSGKFQVPRTEPESVPSVASVPLAVSEPPVSPLAALKPGEGGSPPPSVSPSSAAPAADFTLESEPPPSRPAGQPLALPGPTQALYKATPEGVRISPEPAADANVAQMADPKQLKVQRGYLLAALAQAKLAAPAAPNGTRLVVEVPGDGTFRLDNNQPAIAEFAERMGRKFPRADLTPGDRFYHAPKPSAVTPVPKVVDSASLTKAATLAVSTDDTRYILRHVLSEDGFGVSTDGRRLFLVAGAKGLTAREILKANREAGGGYPNWRQVLPEWLTAKAGKVAVGQSAPPAFALDTAEGLKALHQAKSVIGEKSDVVHLYDVGEGKLGFGANSRDLGDYASDGVRDGMAPLASLAPEFLADALTAARLAGHAQVRIFVSPADASGKQPVAVVGGQTFAALVMNLRGGPDETYGVAGAMWPAGAKAPKPEVTSDKGQVPRPAPVPSVPSVPSEPVAPAAVDESRAQRIGFIKGPLPKGLPTLKVEIAPRADGAFAYQLDAHTNETGYGTPWTGNFPTAEAARTAAVGDLNGWLLTQSASSRAGQPTFKRQLGAIIAQLPALSRAPLAAAPVSPLAAPKPGEGGSPPPPVSPSSGGTPGAAASPDFAADSGALAGAAAPPRGSPPAPTADPAFTQLPVELPEFVQLYRALSGGMYPKIIAKIRALRGTALGVFRYREGVLDSGEIELRADIFNLLTVEDKQALLREAFLWAKAEKENNPGLDLQAATAEKFKELVKAAEAASAARGPLKALATAWHEVGHWLDFIPEATLKRGNILGRLASATRFYGKFLAERPGLVAAEPTAGERAKLHRLAEKQLRDEVGSIVEEITRTEPVYKELPLTADDVKNIVGLLARAEFPEFYNWFAQLDRDTKKAVLKLAMQGIVDERAKAFGKRTPTGETRTVTEKITRQTGAPVTPQAIQKRYEELLRAELKARGLISEVDVRRELYALIAWWRGVPTVPAYFQKTPEMWAEAMSVFWNNPFALAERAPTFYRAFMQWMAVKPGLRMDYDKLQADIASGQVQKDRVQNLHDSWRQDAVAGHALEIFLATRNWQHVRDNLRLLFDRQFGPIERRVLQSQRAAAKAREGAFSIAGHRLGEQARTAIERYLLRTTAWESWGYELRRAVEVPLAAAGLTRLQLSEYMFHMRIVHGRYKDLASPLGWNPKNSAERLAEMRAELGPARFVALEDLQKGLRRIYATHVIPLLDASGIMSPALAAAVHAEVYYAPFNQAREFVAGETDGIAALVRLHYGEEAAGKIFSALGNLGAIRDPYVQFQHRTLALISTAYRQIAVKAIVAWLRENEPESYAPAETRMQGNRRQIVENKHPLVGTLFTDDAGQVNGHYVPRAIAEMFERGGEAEMMLVGLAMKTLGPFKAVLTEFNPGFWAVAFTKDVQAAMHQLPGNTAALPKYLWRAHAAARATFSGKDDPLAAAALRRLMVISRVEQRGDHAGHADEMTRLFLRLGQQPVLWNAEVNKIERALRTTFAWLKTQGQTFERAVKIASMMYVDEKLPHLPESEKHRLVTELGGSPPFLQKGREAPVLDIFYMFHNPWKEAVRATARAAQRDPKAFWAKFVATIGLGAAAWVAFEAGLFDGGMDPETAEDYRDMVRAIPERDKLQGFAIPLFWVDKAQGKVFYVLLRFSDNQRWLHALARKALQGATGQGGDPVGPESIVKYQGQDLPGLNPALEAGVQAWQYFVQKRNPHDSFTGRGALDQDAVEAREAGGELAANTLANLTGGILWRPTHEQRTVAPGELEKFLRLPVISNILGRWLRVSNRGQAEQFQRDAQPTRQEQARLRVLAEPMLVRLAQGLDFTPQQLSLLAESPYVLKHVSGAARSTMVGATSPLLKALVTARSDEERLAILSAENDRQRVREYRRTHGGRNPPE